MGGTPTHRVLIHTYDAVEVHLQFGREACHDLGKMDHFGQTFSLCRFSSSPEGVDSITVCIPIVIFGARSAFTSATSRWAMDLLIA